jgi:two-component system cell cycle response regulator PopA
LREDFGQSPTIGDLSPDRKFRVLFIGKASPSFMVIINALQDKGVEVTAAFTSFSAFDYLHGDPFDAVVMNALDQTEPAFSISETMRRNSKLFHTPTLFLVKGHSFKDYDGAYKRGARDIIDCDADSEEIRGRILELANYHRIHEQMKSDFLNLAVDAAVDESGTAYSQEFLRAHLPRISRDAAKLDVPVSLIGLKLTSQSVDHVTSEAIEAAYSKTADLLNNLVRMQDVVCRWDKDKFILAFYDTNQTEAEIILTRVRALLDCAVYQTGSSERGALGVSAQSVIVPLQTNPLASENQLDALIANLVNDPDET